MSEAALISFAPKIIRLFYPYIFLHPERVAQQRERERRKEGEMSIVVVSWIFFAQFHDSRGKFSIFFLLYLNTFSIPNWEVFTFVSIGFLYVFIHSFIHSFTHSSNVLYELKVERRGENKSKFAETTLGALVGVEAAVNGVEIRISFKTKTITSHDAVIYTRKLSR